MKEEALPHAEFIEVCLPSNNCSRSVQSLHNSGREGAVEALEHGRGACRRLIRCTDVVFNCYQLAIDDGQGVT